MALRSRSSTVRSAAVSRSIAPIRTSGSAHTASRTSRHRVAKEATVASSNRSVA
ncbi:Uncharacterised protein [Mycobacteroides abscessus subsp. abscessus]|nr:Uncharacterised protein [Mycobacteroides abscessus subsp. abscessus]